jgi:hypothetical protein
MLEMNLSGVCRFNLKKHGLENPSELDMVKGTLNILVVGLVMRTFDNSLKTSLSSSLNLMSRYLNDF